VVDKGDDVAVENLTRILGIQSDVVPLEAMEAFKFHFKAGWGGYPLVGTAEQIVEELDQLSRVGIDGVVLSWVNYPRELRQWIAEVMPVMEQAGLRKPLS
jgi:alkanesulfonate monooxygenase SsuD/methylene tetrahydromethanopterin reductase-like flavin-dependent oxidoreductase (luciferase family)